MKFVRKTLSLVLLLAVLVGVGAWVAQDALVLPVAAEETAEDIPLVPVETIAETEEDLGSVLSPARVSYALRMTVLGMGMVFSVLALLWLVLVIFKNALAEKPAKAKANTEEVSEPAPAPAPAATPAPAGDDPAIIAAITAAIAATIDSDPALSQQFAGGFRVVSFKKKSGKTSWNH